MTTVSDIAAALGQDNPSSAPVAGVSTLSAPRPSTLAFTTRWSEAIAETVRAHPDTCFLVPEDADLTATNAIRVARPRLAYARVVRDLLEPGSVGRIEPTAVVDPEARVGHGVSIGHFAVVEAGVTLADGVRIDHHVVLKSGVSIGPRSRVGSHTSIGGPGFGFEVDEVGRPIRLGHWGGVEIGEDVEIGHHCAIAQGTIEPTKLRDHVKVDDCVFIAHNVEIGESSFVIAGAEISGSVRIGQRAWISPEATITNKVVVGDDALVGLGAVVVKDVEANTVVAGVPAKPRGLRHQR